MKNRKDFMSADSRKIKEILAEEFNSHKPDPVFKNTVFSELTRKYYYEQKIQPKTRKKTKNQKSIFNTFFIKLKKAYKSVLIFTILSSFSVTTAYAYNSPSVTRNSDLYFLKRSVESIEMGVIFNEQEKAKKYIKFANRRNDEIEYLSKQGIEDEQTLDEIEQNIAYAIEIAQASGNEEDIRRLIQESGLLPDLQIVNIRNESFIEKEKAHFFIDIKNEGKIKTDSFVVTLTFDDIEKDVKVKSIYPNKTRSVVFDYTFNKKGEYLINVIVDSKNNIKEKVENNNWLQKLIIVGESCKNECPMLGVIQCNGNLIQECIQNDGECRKWETTEDCGSNGKCIRSECIYNCSNQCNSIGQKRCSGKTIQSCQKSSNGCLIWTNEQTCDNEESCKNGVCQKTCVNKCRDGAIRSSDEKKWEFCVDLYNTGCTDWYTLQIIDAYRAYKK